MSAQSAANRPSEPDELPSREAKLRAMVPERFRECFTHVWADGSVDWRRALRGMLSAELVFCVSDEALVGAAMAFAFHDDERGAS